MNKLLPLVAIGTMLLGFSSCKKTIDYEKVAQNEILEFKITNLQESTIYGSIDHAAHTITVYVPYYHGLSLIDPEIKVSAGAKIVEEIVPVLIDNKNTSYTVKAADGTTSVYKLIIVQQNTPDLKISWFSLEPGEYTAYPTMRLPGIIGNFLSTNGRLVKVSLTSVTTNKVIVLEQDGGLRTIETGYYYASAPLPADIEPGYYKTRVEFLGHDVTLPENLRVAYQQPNLLMPSREVKQGGTITFQPFNSVFVGLKSVKVKVLGKTYNLTVDSFSPLLMTLKFPDDFPVGKYYYSAAYTFEFEGWPLVEKVGDLTVFAK